MTLKAKTPEIKIYAENRRLTREQVRTSSNDLIQMTEDSMFADLAKALISDGYAVVRHSMQLERAFFRINPAHENEPALEPKWIQVPGASYWDEMEIRFKVDALPDVPHDS